MPTTTRRRLLGTTLVSAGALLAGLGIARGQAVTTKGRIMLDTYHSPKRGLIRAATFPLIEAIHGRRSRHFALGASIPEGPLAYTSRHAAKPLDPLEQMLLIATISGNTGWAKLFAHHPGHAPKMPNYTASAGGRTFPSSAGFATSEFFFTDDSGVYFLPTRDMKPLPSHGGTELDAWLEAHRARIVKLANRRLNIPAEMPHMEGHNTWCANVQGSTLVWPVADVTQHTIPAAALPGTERDRHLRRPQRAGYPRAGTVPAPAEPQVA